MLRHEVGWGINSRVRDDIVVVLMGSGGDSKETVSNIDCLMAKIETLLKTCQTCLQGTGFVGVPEIIPIVILQTNPWHLPTGFSTL